MRGEGKRTDHAEQGEGVLRPSRVIMGNYFGTDGFRGEANVVLTARHAYEIGRYVGNYTVEKRGEGGGRARVVIGKDPRRSSYMFEYALAAGLVASGADAYLLHVTTTPSVSFITRSEGFDCGVMISASHNPYRDNGIKIFDSQGGKADEEMTDGIERYLDAVAEDREYLPYAVGEAVGRTVDFSMGRNRYIGQLIALSKVSFSGLKIGLDCANGSAFFIAKSVFDALGCVTECLNVSPDGLNVNENCGSTRPFALQKLVKEKGLDMGFAFDGDGDRCICVDEKGEIRDGDHILYAEAIDLRENGELDGNTIVSTVTSNGGLAESLKKHGVECRQSRVGDRFVYEKMQELGASLGGEQSGHIIFSKHMPTGDGILTAIKLAETAVEKKKKFSDLFEGLTVYPQVSANVKVGHKTEIVRSTRLQAAAFCAEEKLRLVGGRLLLRPSGTEEVIRILAEAPDGNFCKEVVSELEREIESLDRKL